VIASPLTRCRKLAAAIAAARGLPLKIDPRWREMSFGAWEGTAWDAIPRDALDAWAANFRHYADHGGESVFLLESRVRAALADTPEDALVVTHHGCIKAALAIRGQGAGWDSQTDFGAWVRLD
jgi:alpha-ribazole phosphatase